MFNSTCSMVGPMPGAFLMSITTFQYAMLVDVLGAFLAVSTLSFVKIPTQSIGQSSKLSFMQDIKYGIRAFKSNKALLRLSAPMLISTIIFVPIGTLLPLMVKEYFNGTAWHNCIVQTLFSSGMLIAAMLIGITGGLKKQFLMISISTGLLGLCSLIGGILPAHFFGYFLSLYL